MLIGKFELVEDKKFEIKYLKLKLHIKYILCITGIIITLVIGWTLRDKDSIIESLSNSSILFSIVLAIIGILISLWDVAGQRGALIDVKEQVESLRNFVKEINDHTNESRRVLKELNDLDERFRVDFSPINQLPG